MIRTLIDEAVVAGARRWRACEVLGITARTVERWKTDDDGRHGPNHEPLNRTRCTDPVLPHRAA